MTPKPPLPLIWRFIPIFYTWQFIFLISGNQERSDHLFQSSNWAIWLVSFERCPLLTKFILHSFDSVAEAPIRLNYRIKQAVLLPKQTSDDYLRELCWWARRTRCMCIQNVPNPLCRILLAAFTFMSSSPTLAKWMDSLLVLLLVLVPTFKFNLWEFQWSRCQETWFMCVCLEWYQVVGVELGYGVPIGINSQSNESVSKFLARKMIEI